MYYQRLSDEEILSGFREGDADIIREYFYGYCQVGYNIFDQRYQLREKENLDFMSLAHQYALYLMEHDWKPLEDHSPNVSLKTWLINGFRYVVLDALKWYRKEYGSITFEDYLMSFDVTSDLRLQFNRMVEDVCDHAPLDRQERLIIDMLLLHGFKSKEIAAQMGMTPSAISQKYKKLKEQIIVPYFRKNFDMDLDMPEVMDEMAILRREATMGDARMSMPAPSMPGRGYGLYQRRSYGEKNYTRVYYRAAAERNLRVWQQSQRYARRWCGVYRLSQVWSHYGPGRGSAGTELCYPDDAGRCRDHPSVCGRVHRVRQKEQESDVPCYPHRLWHCWIHG